MNAALDIPDLIASRYVPIRLIAKGGMGAVYEVEHLRTGEHLALKVLLAGVGASAEAQERFKREARASARIKSEHVVRVTDADVAPELGGAPFLVMELLEGADLERHTAVVRPEPGTVVHWLRQVAGVIDRAHRLGIIHRDLKPENLFLNRRENGESIVKVLDFGIIKIAEERTAASQEGRILGTPQYMAPEQLAADMEITSAVDRYALGLVAYRLLAGSTYYQGDVMSVLAQKLHQPLLKPSERQMNLGAAFDEWFLKACHREPGQRFVSAVEQIAALAEALGEARVPSELASAPTLAGEPLAAPPPSERRPRALVVATLLVGVAAAAIVGARVLLRRPEVTPAARAPAASAPVPARVEAAKPIVPAPPSVEEAPPPPAPAPAAATDPSRGPRVHRPGPRHTPAAAPAGKGVAPPPAPDPYADQK
jgi:serine/threonine protein kinase